MKVTLSSFPSAVYIAWARVVFPLPLPPAIPTTRIGAPEGRDEISAIVDIKGVKPPVSKAFVDKPLNCGVGD